MGTASPQYWDENSPFRAVTSPQNWDILIYHTPRRSEGRNYLGLRKPQLNTQDKIMDDLIDQPEAYALYLMFQRWHSHRPFFAIAPRAMSEAGSPPWPRRKIALARDVLLDRGYLIEVVPPRRGVSAGHYRFSGEMPGSGHNHNTFPSSALVEVAGHA